MEDLLKFGGAIFGVFLLLLGALFLTTRLYIHSIRKWMRRAQREVQGIRSELGALDHRINKGEEALDRVEELENV